MEAFTQQIQWKGRKERKKKTLHRPSEGRCEAKAKQTLGSYP